MAIDRDPLYVRSRRVLLDALDSLGPHRRSVVLVGAQALYLRVGSGALPVAPFTTDGDLALNPVGIADEPLLVEALTSAGFVLAVRPGSWTRDSVSIDLMVPATLCESGRRAARLGAHGADTARQTVGIEAALVDNDHLLLGALDPSDGRTHTVAVAGLAALLVAKLHKLVDRESSPARSLSKDGLDVLRILQECDLAETAAKLAQLEKHPMAGDTVTRAHDFLPRLFGRRDGHGVEMAIRATVGIESPGVIAESCIRLAEKLIESWRRARPV